MRSAAAPRKHDELFVLLVERRQKPFMGAWALPGGLVRPNEDPEAAAIRELAEETGIYEEPGHLEQLGTYAAPDREPGGRVVSIAYWAIEANLPPPLGADDAGFPALVPMSKIEHGGIALAFDHERIVRDAVERTRSKLEYTTLAAKFCPPEFTISQLRRVYESVWSVELDQGNFHRQVIGKPGFLQPLEHTSKPGAGGGGRPASLWSAGDTEVLESPIYRKPPAQAPQPTRTWDKDKKAERHRQERVGQYLRDRSIVSGYADGVSIQSLADKYEMTQQRVHEILAAANDLTGIDLQASVSEAAPKADLRTWDTSVIWGCSDFPSCRGSRPVGNSRSADTPDCPKCAGPMVKRKVRGKAALRPEPMSASADAELVGVFHHGADTTGKIHCGHCGGVHSSPAEVRKCSKQPRQERPPVTESEEPLDGYSGQRTAEIVGITYRQLDYWARTDLVRPSMADARGSGLRRRYSYRDLLQLRVIKALLDAGIRLQLIRDIFGYLEDHLDEDLTQVNLVIQGTSVIVRRGNEEIVDLLRDGQGVLNILPLAGVKADLDAKIVELYPKAGRVEPGRKSRASAS